MKILLLADQAEPTLWEHLDKRKLEGVELVLSCGDLPASYLSFLTCFTSAPILYIRGNHDDRYDKHPPEGCECIEDQVVTVGGLRILGLGGSMRYNRGINSTPNGKCASASIVCASNSGCSGGIDILLTHSPARHLGDDTDLAHIGFETFLDVMDRYHPRYMVHGHVHQNYQYNFKRIRQHGDTTVINAFG